MSNLVGPDISNWNPNWSVKSTDAFVIIKCSLGQRTKNALLQEQVNKVRSANRVVMFYHWLQPSSDASVSAQVRHMAAQLDGLYEEGDPLWIDWEQTPQGFPSEADKDQMVRGAQVEFSQSCVGIYTTASRWNSSQKKIYDGLWIAHHNGKPGRPSIQEPFVLHQYDGSGNNKALDMNWSMFADLSQLNRWRFQKKHVALPPTDSVVPPGKETPPVEVFVPDPTRKPPSSDRPAFTPRKYAKKKIRVSGCNTTERGWAMLQEAGKLYTARTGKKPPGVTQSGWSNSVGASAGTHAREGFDWATAPLTDAENRIWQECCRTVGFADWWRRPLPGVWSEHNHGVPKDGVLSPSAAAQVKAFRLGRDGLAGNRADPSIGAFKNVTFESYLMDRDAPKLKINGKFYADFGSLSVRVLNEAWISGEFSRRVYVVQDWLQGLGLYKSALDGNAGMFTKAGYDEFRRVYLRWTGNDAVGLPGVKSLEWLRLFVNSSRKVVA